MQTPPIKRRQKPSCTEDVLKKYPRKNGYPVIHWTDIQGNKFLNAINPMMLSPEGYSVFKQARINGQRQWEDRIQCFVYYDRQFVIEKLAFHFLELKCLGFNEIQKIIGEVWAFGKQIDEDEF